MPQLLSAQKNDNSTGASLAHTVRVSSAGVLLIALILIGFFSLSLPLASTISVAFSLSPAGLTPSAPQATFSRVALSQVLGTQLNIPVLSFVSGQRGQYMVYVLVRYGSSDLPSQSFKDLGFGTYQMKVTYVFRFENPSVPYQITLVPSIGGLNGTAVPVLVYPS